MKKYFLTQVGIDTFIMLNAKDKLTNNMCNSTLFATPEDAALETSVFDFFGVSVTILNDGYCLDRRTHNFKLLASKYGYFSAGFLPEISKRANKPGQLPKPSWIK